jgi:nucleotide-binding universal stress UspA family protein
MFKKILLPTDGSDIAQACAAQAVAFARACGADLLVLSVARPTYLMPSDDNTMTSDPGFGVEALMKAADDYVQYVADMAQVAGVPCTTLTIFSDSPCDEIVAVAEREQCDLIAMASHPGRRLRKILAGSETIEVLASSSIPVLVLRPDVGALATPALL